MQLGEQDPRHVRAMMARGGIAYYDMVAGSAVHMAQLRSNREAVVYSRTRPDLWGKPDTARYHYDRVKREVLAGPVGRLP